MSTGPERRLLFVCTGNVCRSPAAQLLLTGGLGGGSAVRVGSAGLAALVGAPVDPGTAGALRTRGVDPDGFAARQLTPALVQGADLVLTMTAQQRAAVVTRAPAAVRRTFALREFAALVALAPAGVPAPDEHPLDALVRAARQARALRPGSADDDVPDPYRRPAEVHERVLGLVEDAVGVLLGSLQRSPARGLVGPATG